MSSSSVSPRARRTHDFGAGLRNRGLRPGFSLIELLVVLAVISVLLALVMPAVQQARETARRTQCASHLRQLALALHDYHATHAVLPPGSVQSAWSFKALALPYLEQGALHRQIRFENVTGAPCHYGFAEIAAIIADGRTNPATASIPLFYCPSDPLAGTVRAPRTPEYHFRAGSYLGVAGDSVWIGRAEHPNCIGMPYMQLVGNGLLFIGSAVRLEHVTDGTTQTMLIGERGVPWDESSGRDMCGGAWDPWLEAGWYDPGGQDPIHTNHFWSHHPGGSQFAFADGSVRQLSYGISSYVFRSLATRDGGEIIGEF